MNRNQRNTIADINDVADQFNQTLSGIERSTEDQESSLETLSDCWESVIQLEDHVERIRNLLDAESYRVIYSRILEAKNNLSYRLETLPESEDTPRIRRLENVGKKGNSFCDIDKGTLVHLLSLGFSVCHIARNGLLGGKLHPNTVYNFMKRNNIRPQSQRFTEISDEEITTILKELADRYPNSGINEVKAFLKTRDPQILIPEKRFRRIFSAINPEAGTRRWTKIIKRRKYRVSCPNALWHIDTNHKLIRWNFVIDGAIDGYSRVVLYLRVHTNNLASTAFHDFSTAIRNFGVPSRVRADKGSEFVHIEKFMDRVNQRKSFIKGKSVHNQRIERLWRDVYCKVIDKYHRLFHYMEDFGILDIDNEVHIAALHFVFGIRIQQDLDQWSLAYNAHNLRTANSKTPLQLWHEGLYRNSTQSYTAINNALSYSSGDRNDFINSFLEHHNMNEPTDIGIVLPRVALPLTGNEENELERNINPLAASANLGIDIYADVLRFVDACVNG